VVRLGRRSPKSSRRIRGALPLTALEPGDNGGANLDPATGQIRPGPKSSLVAKAGGLPVTADMERLNKVWENV
jgi:hypothetical protein